MHTLTQQNSVMYKSRAWRTAGHRLSSSPRTFFSSSSFVLHTHSPSFHLAHPPISALKYIMKHDDCWHTGTACAFSAASPSLSLLPLSAMPNAWNWVTELHVHIVGLRVFRSKSPFSALASWICVCLWKATDALRVTQTEVLLLSSEITQAAACSVFVLFLTS